MAPFALKQDSDACVEIVPTHASTGCGACQKTTPLFPFSMAFQPIVDAEQRAIIAYEALVRGPANEGARQVISQVNADNLYMFDQACRTRAISLAAQLGLSQRLNINFLPNAVYDPRACIRATLDAADRTGFDLNKITFEIVESETLSETAHLINIIREYRQHGFKIALDDFGTGYSGLSRLVELKPDTIKLDRILIQDCDKDEARMAIVARMVDLGRDLGIDVVVEGVETTEELRALRQAGVRFMQGFLFSKPLFEELCLPAAAFDFAAAPLGV